MSERSVRVVMVSGVRHADDYIPLLEQQPGVEVVGLVDDIDPESPLHERSEGMARRFGLPFHDELQALQSCGADLAVICSEPTRHAHHAAAALGAGLHTIIDKPCAINREQLAMLGKAEAESGCWATVVNRLMAPSAQELRAAVTSGMIGLPLIINVEFIASGDHLMTSVGPAELVANPQYSGGGEIMNFMPYFADLVVDCLGLKPQRVHALSSTQFSDAHRRFGVEDCSVINVEFEREVSALATIARAARTPQGSPTSTVAQITGTHGYRKVSDEEPMLLLQNKQGTRPPQDIAKKSLAAVFAEAIQAVKRGSRPRWTLQDSVAAMEIVLAAEESARTGEWVHVRNERGEIDE